MIVRTAEDRKSEKIIVIITRWLRAIVLAVSTTLARGSFSR